MYIHEFNVNIRLRNNNAKEPIKNTRRKGKQEPTCGSDHHLLCTNVAFSGRKTVVRLIKKINKDEQIEELMYNLKCLEDEIVK